MSSYTSSSDPWAHSGYNATAAHLEREFASNPDQNFQSFSNASGSRGYTQQQHLQAAPQSAQLPGLDRNLWPQRSMAGGLTPTGYPVNAMPRSNSIHNYHQQTFAPELTNPQLYTNNPSQSYLPPTHLGQQSIFNSNQDQSGAYQSGLPSAGFPSSSPAMTQTSLPMSSHPTSPVTPPVGPPYFQAPPPSSTRTGHTDLVRKNSATNKRIRLSGPDFPRDEDGDSDELLQESPEATKAKPPGACARCKELKVKCEFRTETDPCRRCLNAGRECVIPGRKKRRTPPKREHLLNQIREQAEQIQNLMAKLEESNKEGPGSGTSENFALPSSRTNASLHSPILSPSTTFPSASSVFETNKVVEDWISKARESLAEFGGFIGLGGSGTNIPKSYLMEKDVEDSSSSDEDYVDAQTGDDDIDGGYGIAVVEAADGNEWAHVTPEGAKLSRASSNSSQHAKQKKDDASSKLATLPSEAVPFGLMAQLSLKNHRRLSQHQPDKMETNEDEEGNQLGVASADFFRLSPEPETRGSAPPPVNLPHILTRNIITVEEAEHLFKIYFDKMNLSCSNLDPVLYTAQRTCFRSPFLFTTICAIASRFYVERPDLYPQAMHYAQLAAGTSLLSGPKSVEMCHAYLLLSIYPVPARRYEEDRSWIFLGLAIRIAIDLNLHIPVTAQPKNENHAREMLNRTRCYLNLCNVDRSMGSQYGKHPILPSTDYIACHSADWWRSSPFNMKHFDIQLCCYNEELRTLAKFRNKIYSDPEHPTGLNRRVDFDLLCKETDDELQALKAKWMTLIEENTDMNDLQNRFRTGLLRLAFSYARLAVLSFGFQHAFDKNNADEVLLRRCLTAAKDVVNVLLLDIGRPETKIYLRHGPDAQRVFVTFAAAFMVKLLQPKFVTFLPVEERLEIRRLVKSVADLLGSPEIAVDERHGPKLYSRFLKGLLATPMAKVVVDAKQLQDLRQQRQQHGGGPGSPGTLPSSVYSSPSPEAGLSSPPPNQAAMSFDQFTETAPIDPFAPATMMHHQQNGALGASPESSSGMDAFFSPPLPFDHEILSSMQSLTDPNVWQDSMLPGFNWMSSYQSQSPPPNNPSQNYSQFYQ